MDKIMIIEDDPAICLGLEDLLSNENLEVISFPNGKEGLRNALSIIPDLIILDLNLPGINGLDICRALRESSFNNPIVMLTARSEQIDKVIGLEIGADDYLTKPFDQRELLARVRAHLRRSARSRTSAEAKSVKSKHKRKLLTIMFTDVKDYSKKMNNDENMTIDLLKTHNSIMNQTINEYNGNIIETAGDGYLVCFDSTIDAVRCALTTQSGLFEYNKHKSENEKIELRIGIHLGDVVEFENKIKGDILNITARIQQNAQPGKIDVSESVYNSVKNKMNLKVEDKQNKSLKNIKDPMTIYTVGP